MQAFISTIIALLMCSLMVLGDPGSKEQMAQDAYARWQLTGTATPDEKDLMEDVLFGRSGRTQEVNLDHTGGPDVHGYCWTDNLSGDTATFAWIELCGDPEAQYGPTGDDAAGLIVWSFPFPFYGSTYTSAYISTNGKIAFSSADAAWFNVCSSADATQPVISVHWDDLVAQQTEDCGGGTPRIKYRDFGNHVVIEWKHLWHYPYPGEDQRYSFEAILYADGRIKLQYDTLNCGDTYCNSATVGIDVPGPAGMFYVCNGSPASCELSHNRAVWFYTPPPYGLTIHTVNNDVILRWCSVTGALGYRVYRGLTSDLATVPGNLIHATPDTTCIDTGILNDPASPYFYTVTAVMP